MLYCDNTKVDIKDYDGATNKCTGTMVPLVTTVGAGQNSFTLNDGVGAIGTDTYTCTSQTSGYVEQARYSDSSCTTKCDNNVYATGVCTKITPIAKIKPTSPPVTTTAVAMKFINAYQYYY